MEKERQRRGGEADGDIDGPRKERRRSVLYYRWFPQEASIWVPWGISSVTEHRTCTVMEIMYHNAFYSFLFNFYCIYSYDQSTA